MNRLLAIATTSTLGLSCLAAASTLAGPPDLARVGGLPVCEEKYLSCEDDLAICLENDAAFPATGQTSCWEFNGLICVVDSDCTNPAFDGHDGDVQAGATLSYTDTGMTIIDNNTKLEWMKQDDNDSLGTGDIRCDPGGYPGNLDKDCKFNWDQAFEFVAKLNANNHAGHTDWRVPNVKELQSIINYEKSYPAVSVEFDTECIEGCTVMACSCTAGDRYDYTLGHYWTSTTAETCLDAWSVCFAFGSVYSAVKEGYLLSVRAVRGGL